MILQGPRKTFSSISVEPPRSSPLPSGNSQGQFPGILYAEVNPESQNSSLGNISEKDFFKTLHEIRLFQGRVHFFVECYRGSLKVIAFKRLAVSDNGFVHGLSFLN